jgi:membrane protein YdbS with pleckstrin-like domain
MTRGHPAAWSTVFGTPFLACGVYVYALQSRYPLLGDGPTAPPVAGVPLALFGLFVVGLGLYVQVAGLPGSPRMRENERVVYDRTPAQRSALLKTFSSVPFLALGLDLLYFTASPLVYPTVVLVVGLYLFSTGIHEYWRNTLTRYVLTNRRMVEEYRFVSLVRNEVPLEKVRAVEERRSILDTLFGLGNVHVRAGATGDLSVTVRSVYDSTPFADAIRDEMDGQSGVPTRAADGTSTDTTGTGTTAVLPADGRRDEESETSLGDPSSNVTDGGLVGATRAADEEGGEAVPAPDDQS